MTERYVWRDGAFRDKRTGRKMKVRDKNAICRPHVQSDVPAYMSVVSNKMIDGKSDRREDLKRSGCREVDPSERIIGCRSEKWAKRLNQPLINHDAPRLSDQKM